MPDNVEDLAWRVWKIARFGQIFVTDDVTGSSNLVGFFIPAIPMNALGRALSKTARSEVSPSIEFHPREKAPVWEADFWVGLAVGLAVTGIILLAMTFLGTSI